MRKITKLAVKKWNGKEVRLLKNNNWEYVRK